MAYTYMLRCCDGSLYTGWTNDLGKRLAAHRSGKGARYTKSHRPVSLAYFECMPSKEDAMRREYQIKQLTRQEKEALIAALPDDILQQIETINAHIPQQDFQ
ncbi:MAG: GIY-YIG nuclease family protein [Lachnospiraceae bacterium]|nr:GIY-YIG nuclease family protein [Lachnospiraceae bacterium]